MASFNGVVDKLNNKYVIAVMVLLFVVSFFRMVVGKR